MNPKALRKLALWAGTLVTAASILGCNLARQVTPTAPVIPTSTIPSNSVPTDTPAVLPTDTAAPASTDTASPTAIVHTVIPGELPAGELSEVSDMSSSGTASQHRAAGGDNIALNVYERPFNANTMDQYFPDLDIVKGRVFGTPPWIYVTITLVGQSSSGGLTGDYGVELDLNLDGRGDVLVMASKPGKAWSTDGVRAWIDANHDVGSAHPVSPDAPQAGDGYEIQVFDQGAGDDPDLAWARVSPTDPNTVQIAFKQALINNDMSFAWGVWAMSPDTFNPGWFDYNDHFTAAQMGSPLAELKSYYPVKSFSEVDNTCRWVVGFTPTGSEPGLCPMAATPTPALPGTINGRVFNDDTNRDGIFDSTSYPYQNIPVEVHQDTCSGNLVGTATSNQQGYYTIQVPAGKYCVIITQRTDPNGAPPQTVTVPNGGTVNDVNFAFWS